MKKNSFERKKIAFLIGALTPGGAERVISTLSNELVDEFDVVIITFRKSTPFYRLDSRIKVISCFDTIDNPKSAFHSLKLNFALLNKVTSISKKEHVDLLIGFITSANIIATLAAKRLKIKCIISERNNPLKTDIPRFWRILRTYIYPLADHLVTQTKKVKELYTNVFKLRNMTVIPNPISPDFSDLIKSETTQEKTILTVGRLIEDKCQDLIIKAFYEINPKDWKLLIIGKGPCKKKLLNLIELLNLKGRVEILSEIKNIEFYYTKSSVFVFMSKSEGFPNALLEAFHFGLPCISTDCNYGPSDIITDGENGFLVPVDDKNELEAKLKLLINDAELQKFFSKNALETSKTYSSKKIAHEWKTLINKLLE